MKIMFLAKDQVGFYENSKVTQGAVGPYPHSGQGAASVSAVWDDQPPDYFGRSRLYRDGLKRSFDVTLVLATSPFWLPVIMLCALALWIEGGKPFYFQKRLGRDGSRFSLIKLRSMVCGADAMLKELCARDPELKAEWETLQKLRNDPRITPVGRFLRATSLDELPQLFNVLKGEMSLVGPRPMMPEQLPGYGDPQAYFAVRPGITGLWQVGERNNSTFAYRRNVDLEYAGRVTLGGDMRILRKTVGVVLRRTGC